MGLVNQTDHLASLQDMCPVWLAVCDCGNNVLTIPVRTTGIVLGRVGSQLAKLQEHILTVAMRYVGH